MILQKLIENGNLSEEDKKLVEQELKRIETKQNKYKKKKENKQEKEKIRQKIREVEQEKWFNDTRQKLIEERVDAEKAFGVKLKAAGYKYYIQYPCKNTPKPYFGDFFIIGKKLIIELDGGYHNTPEQKQADWTRTKHINQYESIGVIRFTNEVAEKLTLEQLKTHIEGYTGIFHSPLKEKPVNKKKQRKHKVAQNRKRRRH